jgi:hypothetical protein
MIFHTSGITSVLKNSRMWKKNKKLHNCEFTSKSPLRNRKQNQIVIKNPIWLYLELLMHSQGLLLLSCIRHWGVFHKTVNTIDPKRGRQFVKVFMQREVFLH